VTELKELELKYSLKITYEVFVGDGNTYRNLTQDKKNKDDKNEKSNKVLGNEYTRAAGETAISSDIYSKKWKTLPDN
jgi:hypothetical protein